MTQRPVVKRSESGQLVLWCPGCKRFHVVWTTERPHPISQAAWEFNGEFVRPTIRPSILVRGRRDITDEEAERIMAGEALDIPELVCHSFVRDGQIQFLDDSTHALAGKTVPLEPMP